VGISLSGEKFDLVLVDLGASFFVVEVRVSGPCLAFSGGGGLLCAAGKRHESAIVSNSQSCTPNHLGLGIISSRSGRGKGWVENDPGPNQLVLRTTSFDRRI